MIGLAFGLASCGQSDQDRVKERLAEAGFTSACETNGALTGRFKDEPPNIALEQWTRAGLLVSIADLPDPAGNGGVVTGFELGDDSACPGQLPPASVDGVGKKTMVAVSRLTGRRTNDRQVADVIACVLGRNACDFDLEEPAAKRSKKPRRRPSPFNAVIDRLPLRQPPLHPVQILTIGPERLVVLRVEPGRFCAMTPDERRAALASYAELAQRRFRARESIMLGSSWARSGATGESSLSRA